MQNNVVFNIDDIEITNTTDIVEVKQRSLVGKETIYLTVKRTADIVVSSLALIVLMPLMILIAVLIKLDSKGAAILVQERIGKDGKIFKMYKYRSMVDKADEILYEYLKKNKEAKEEYQKYKKLKDDPRVTRVGKFIRKTSIDELPQLINVLIGNMSLVGPRPYLPREKSDMENYYDYIIQSKPGITGIWQVSGRNDVTFKDRLDMDYTYNQSKGTKTDMKLLIKTFLKVIKKEGAI